MAFEFGEFETGFSDDFDVELEEVEVKKVKKLDRMRTVEAGGSISGKAIVHEGKIYFGSWDCYFYCIDIENRKEIWRTPTSSMVQSYLPPVHAVFSIEVKKETHVEEAVLKEKYKKKEGETVSLSDYQFEIEYKTESEYKQKSDYDTSWVIFENPELTEDLLWTLNSEDLNPQTLTSN